MQQSLTSDRPAALFNSKIQGTGRSPGLAQKHVEIWFPISPRVGLLLSWISGVNFLSLFPDMVYELNKRVVALAYREVYCSCKDERVAALTGRATL